MKKLNYFFVLLFLVAVFISCDKRNMEARLEAIPEYTGTAIPIVNVGNTSCEDLDGSYLFSSGRVNYVNGSFDFSDVNTEDWPEGVDSETGWPNGLTVTVIDGKYVTFNYGSDNYCVGAVILKGGNASNVYTYDPAVKSDVNLSSPINASGLPAGLSNLTFCFVECEESNPIVIAIKAFYTAGSDYTVFPGEYSYVTSDGIYIFNPEGPDFDETPGWCDDLGINYYPTTSTFSILGALTESYPGIRENVGTVVVTEEGSNLKVQVTLKPTGGILGNTYLYVGDLAGIYGTGACPVYTSAPWVMATPDPSDLTTVIFTVPYPNL